MSYFKVWALEEACDHWMKCRTSLLPPTPLPAPSQPSEPHGISAWDKNIAREINVREHLGALQQPVRLPSPWLQSLPPFRCGANACADRVLDMCVCPFLPSFLASISLFATSFAHPKRHPQSHPDSIVVLPWRRGPSPSCSLDYAENHTSLPGSQPK